MNLAAPALRSFANGEALAQALADHVSQALKHRIARDGRAALAVSGGRTPLRFFDALAARELDWSAVDITLVDERWVDETSPRSNARLLREHLLQGAAGAARFLPLYVDAATPEAARAQLETHLAALPLPFAAVVLGMGEDGHTASLFPGGDRLVQALDPTSTSLIQAMRAPGAEEPRITLTLPAITASDSVALHIEGEAKRRVLEAALADESTPLPISAVLSQCTHPATIFWCP